jgi:high-affinity nickel-transport protein
VIDLLETSAFGAALVFGFRHGFDWDHLAALTDLTGSQPTSRRSMWLATLYAVGHACMIVVLGVVAILFAEQVPDSLDAAMGRLVGVSLVGLGIWIVWTAIRTRGAPPMRSRWMLLAEAIQRLVARRRGDETVVIEHTHPHDHDHPLHGHEHPHPHSQDLAHEPAEVAVLHAHTHRHVAVAPRDPFMAYGSWSAYGIGLLHGIGAETPTQVLVFAAAAQATDRPSSIGMLLCFVVGLVIANTIVAAASTFGFRSVLGNRVVSIGLATVTAVFSLGVGTLLLLGQDSVLPEIWT